MTRTEDLPEINDLSSRLAYAREALKDFEPADPRRDPTKTNVDWVEIKVRRRSRRGPGDDVRVVLEDGDAARYIANEAARLEARLRELGMTP